MPVEVIMPKVDMDMATGKILVWHVAPGAPVEEGAPLFEIETDKAAMEVEAPASGTLHHPLPEGSEVEIGGTIGWLYADGEAVADAPAANGAPTNGHATGSAVPPKVEPSEPVAPPPSHTDKIRATPVAKRLAAAAELDLAGVKGTGPRGRIRKIDVEQALDAPRAQSADLSGYEGRPVAEIPLDNMRRTVAKRLTGAKATIPHFYLNRDARIDRLLAMRAELNDDRPEGQDKLTLNDFIVKAAAVALTRVPEANAIWGDDRILRFETVDIGVAVSVEGGLFTPVLRGLEEKSLVGISTEMKALAAKARARKLAPQDYAGGTFSISNLGMHGVSDFSAIINPPQSAILAVGQAETRAVFNSADQVEKVTFLRLTLSVDHRVIDGVLGAKLLGAIAETLERPTRLMA
ncbi:MAG: dihydrolipoamide acetyltransferase family protein [Pseudomonadota bacterium]